MYSWSMSIDISVADPTPLERRLEDFALKPAIRVGALRDFLSMRSAFDTNSFQIWAGRLPPVTRRMGELSSFPTQTPTTRFPANPTNQASR